MCTLSFLDILTEAAVDFQGAMIFQSPTTWSSDEVAFVSRICLCRTPRRSTTSHTDRAVFLSPIGLLKGWTLLHSGGASVDVLLDVVFPRTGLGEVNEYMAFNGKIEGDSNLEESRSDGGSKREKVLV